IIGDVLAIDPRTAARQAPVDVLPLLELTLQQLWSRRRGGELTHEAYQQIGAVAGAIPSSCDAALDQLPANQQVIAQRVLSHLVRPADDARGIPAVRQRVPIARLRGLAHSSSPGSDSHDGVHAVDQVLSVLTSRRIIITRGGHQPDQPGPDLAPTAELVHDALIRDWATLRTWMSEDDRFLS